ncbi:ArnT family glycosyltransferase [Arenimonas alkanexedens]
MDQRTWWTLSAVGIGLLALVSLLARPLMPVDETRYLTVAWEMWDRGQFLVPLLNGESYDHKPPALFWLIHLGWLAFGVNEVWPRLIGPLSTLLSLWLMLRLGDRLWPDRAGVGRLASLMFLSCWFIAFYQTALMFDMPLLATVLLAWITLVDAARQGRGRDWMAFAIALGLGLLVKGPVALIYTLPLALSLRYWAAPAAPRPSAPTVLAVIVVALAIPGAWLAAAAWQGSGDYFAKLLVDQTVERVNGGMGHPRPWHWYLPVLLLLPFPWTLWWPAWRGIGAALKQREDRGNRFIFIGFAGTLGILSLVAGKQVHYLVPALALMSLAVARGMHERADAFRAARAVVTGSLLFCVLAMALVFPAVRPYFDLSLASTYIGQQQRQGRAMAYVGNYQGEFGFMGRLQSPVIELTPSEANQWIRRFPEGLVVVREKRVRLMGSPHPEFRQRYKSDALLMFRAADLVASGSSLREATANRY